MEQIKPSFYSKGTVAIYLPRYRVLKTFAIGFKPAVVFLVDYTELLKASLFAQRCSGKISVEYNYGLIFFELYSDCVQFKLAWC